MRAAYFGTWEKGYPRNEQVIAALRSAGVDVDLAHVDVWTDEHKYAFGAAVVPRLLLAEAKLARAELPDEVDLLIVGYPGQFDVWSAKRHGKPIVFNAMVSLYDTLVDDRARFRRGSLAARALRAVDRRALAAADLVVADTQSNARYLSELAGIDEPAVCFVGAEERLFTWSWRPPTRFTVLFVGKLVPLQGIEVILDAARRLPEVEFRIVGSGQDSHLLATRPANIEHIAWLDYELLPNEYANAGCALGVFGSSAKAKRVIPNKVFQALAVGTPVITADTEGARELLTNGVDALLVEPAADALAEAIVALRDDRELASRIGRSGRDTFERRASEAVLGPRWRALLEGVRARRSA
jgi:glycosyltransferase involved in cell wall biosynthesis